MNSPLQLKTYRFLKTFVEANPIQEGEVSMSIGVDSDVRLSEANDGKDWIVILSVKLKENEEAKQPSAYKADITVLGQFSVDSEYPVEKTPRMVAVTGASLLYGVVREMVANITARSIHGEFTLPVTSFVDLDPKKIESQSGNSSTES